MAFYNGVMHEVIRLGLTDPDFIHRANFRAQATSTTPAAQITYPYPGTAGQLLASP